MTEPFRFFPATVRAITDLTPSFRRFTFSGADLADFADPGYDQRIKVVFPLAGTGLATMPTGPDWWPRWRDLPDDSRPPFRTYTTRYVRRVTPRGPEVDVDMVVHDVRGPASAWIHRARPGDELLLLGPVVGHEATDTGVDFVPPRQIDKLLLVGDETAAPAISAILEQVDPATQGIAVLELPDPADANYLPTHPGVDIRVVARAGAAHGSGLIEATRAAVAELAPAATHQEVEEVDVDTDLLWEVPRHAHGAAALSRATLYSWVAGEAGCVKTLRRHLVAERGIDRRAVAFMGYWRLGRAET